MPVPNFTSLSPRVVLNEIDESIVPPVPSKDGILLIGRARSGPAMKPITITSINQFVDIFGYPMDGTRQSDAWRNGNTGAPNYAAFAAQAYLAADIGPVKYVRLLGKAKNDDNPAGWTMGETPSATATLNKTAYGLFLMNSGSKAVGPAVAASTTLEVTGGASAATTQLMTGSTITLTDTAGATYILGFDTRPSADHADMIDAIATNATGSMIALCDNAGAVLTATQDIADRVILAVNTQTVAAITAASGAANQIVLTQDAAGVGGNVSLSPSVTSTATGSYAGRMTTVPFAGGADQEYSRVSGTLGAILYTNGTSICLSGTIPEIVYADTGQEKLYGRTAGSASCMIASNASNGGFQIGIGDGTDTANMVYSNIDFEPSSPNYIRKVLNTDPTKIHNSLNWGSSMTDEAYFLGETFDVNVWKTVLDSGSVSGQVYGFVAALKDGTNGWDDFQNDLKASKTGWFVGQRPDQKMLFRLIALDDGEEFQKNYYCQITDIKLATTANTTAKFTVKIVKRRDGGPDLVVESFAGVNLNSNSPNFIEKRIGSRNFTWSTSEERYLEQGTNNVEPNLSQYVRIELSVTSGFDKSDVPMGFVGPKGQSTIIITKDTALSTTARQKYITAGTDIGLGNTSGSFLIGWPEALTCSMVYPSVRLTDENADGGNNFTYNEMFGLWHKKKMQSNTNASFGDVTKRRVAIDPNLGDGDALSDASFVFTLDDIVSSSAGASTYFFSSGSYKSKRADNSMGQSISGLNGYTGATGLIDGLKIRQFAAPFVGGFDGIDIKYADPFSNARIQNSSNGYPAFSIDQAIEMVTDPEQVKYGIISAPGIVNNFQVRNILKTAENRGDALAIVDLDGIYRPTWDMEADAQSANINTITPIIGNQGYNNSYGAVYFPNVFLRDTLGPNGNQMRVPPSVAGIGAIAKSENLSQPWFAPAGFNRGGLTNLGGSQGPVVNGTVLHLTRDERDVLYDNNINPIARFPATGDTVIFGQKTLYVPDNGGTSALDRINVRRLMLYLKKHIGHIADTILFDPNVIVTWNRFKARAETVLSEVKSELGVTDYKIILDETTTTADLIDQNIMYAQILVKPARAIEYIVVDFIITRSGVEF